MRLIDMRTMTRVAVLLTAVVTLGLTSCEKTQEQMIEGLWQVTSATQTINNGLGDTTYNLQGYSDYWFEFSDNGLCTVTDRTAEFHYDWYIVNGKNLVLTDYMNVTFWYTIEELQAQHMALSYEYTYKAGADSVQMAACQHFELKKH